MESLLVSMKKSLQQMLDDAESPEERQQVLNMMNDYDTLQTDVAEEIKHGNKGEEAATKDEEEGWYDEDGFWFEPAADGSAGFYDCYDPKGQLHETGSYTAAGEWVKAEGSYDAQGNWVPTPWQRRLCSLDLRHFERMRDKPCESTLKDTRKSTSTRKMNMNGTLLIIYIAIWMLHDHRRSIGK